MIKQNTMYINDKAKYNQCILMIKQNTMYINDKVKYNVY